MNMKRQISICIILFLMILIPGLFILSKNNPGPMDSEQENTENITEVTNDKNTESVPSSNEYKNYYFCARTEDGRVVIYDTKTEKLFMETGIEASLLPIEVQAQLDFGIYFKTDVELFDFLESYSS